MNTPLAVQVIQREHQALAAVLRTLPLLLRDARRRNAAPDFAALRAMLFYIEEFQEKLHHVKESAMLFPRLRERSAAADATLARLDHDHAVGRDAVRELSHRLAAWEWLGESHRSAFEQAAGLYVQRYLDHMRVEEDEVLPLALDVLLAEDWTMLDRAFGAHRDPLTLTRPEAPYEALLSTIARITPAPLGLADAA